MERGGRRREVSAATMPRCAAMSASVRGAVACASGCVGATTNSIVISAITRSR